MADPKQIWLNAIHTQRHTVWSMENIPVGVITIALRCYPAFFPSPIMSKKYFTRTSKYYAENFWLPCTSHTRTKTQTKSATFTLGGGIDSCSQMQGALSMCSRDKGAATGECLALLTYHLRRAWVTSKLSTIKEQFLTKSENITTQRDPRVYYHHL